MLRLCFPMILEVGMWRKFYEIMRACQLEGHSKKWGNFFIHILMQTARELFYIITFTIIEFSIYSAYNSCLNKARFMY